MPSSPALTPPRYDVVALATSAGGLEALTVVLRALPADLPAAVIVMQHLGRYGSALVEILATRSTLPVSWIADGTCLTPGRVFVCPPQRMVEVRPDGTCRVRSGVHRAPDLPIDALLRTVADSYGARAIGVVLTGLGRDGAEGVLALARAGAMVLAQTEDSAEHAAMPRAAAATGAVDLVLPLDEIAAVLASVVAGGTLPRSHAETDARASLFTGPGAAAVGPLLAEVDWATTPLGPVAAWPLTLRAAVRIALASHVPMSVYWGPAFVPVANDAFVAMRARDAHGYDAHGYDARSYDARPAGPGRSAREAWAGHAVRATVECVVRTGGAEVVEAADATFSYAPLLDPAAPHGVGGVLVVATETAAGASVVLRT